MGTDLLRILLAKWENREITLAEFQSAALDILVPGDKSRSVTVGTFVSEPHSAFGLSLAELRAAIDVADGLRRLGPEQLREAISMLPESARTALRGVLDDPAPMAGLDPWAILRAVIEQCQKAAEVWYQSEAPWANTRAQTFEAIATEIEVLAGNSLPTVSATAHVCTYKPVPEIRYGNMPVVDVCDCGAWKAP